MSFDKAVANLKAVLRAGFPDQSAIYNNEDISWWQLAFSASQRKDALLGGVPNSGQRFLVKVTKDSIKLNVESWPATPLARILRATFRLQSIVRQSLAVSPGMEYLENPTIKNLGVAFSNDFSFPSDDVIIDRGRRTSPSTFHELLSIDVARTIEHMLPLSTKTAYIEIPMSNGVRLYMNTAVLQGTVTVLAQHRGLTTIRVGNSDYLFSFAPRGEQFDKITSQLLPMGIDRSTARRLVGFIDGQYKGVAVNIALYELLDYSMNFLDMVLNPEMDIDDTLAECIEVLNRGASHGWRHNESRCAAFLMFKGTATPMIVDMGNEGVGKRSWLTDGPLKNNRLPRFWDSICLIVDVLANRRDASLQSTVDKCKHLIVSEDIPNIDFHLQEVTTVKVTCIIDGQQYIASISINEDGTTSCTWKSFAYAIEVSGLKPLSLTNSSFRAFRLPLQIRERLRKRDQFGDSLFRVTSDKGVRLMCAYGVDFTRKVSKDTVAALYRTFSVNGITRAPTLFSMQKHPHDPYVELIIFDRDGVLVETLLRRYLVDDGEFTDAVKNLIDGMFRCAEQFWANGYINHFLGVQSFVLFNGDELPRVYNLRNGVTGTTITKSGRRVVNTMQISYVHPLSEEVVPKYTVAHLFVSLHEFARGLSDGLVRDAFVEYLNKTIVHRYLDDRVRTGEWMLNIVRADDTDPTDILILFTKGNETHNLLSVASSTSNHTKIIKKNL